MHGKGIGNVITNISSILVTVTCACAKAAGREMVAVIALLPSHKELVVNSPRTVAVKECMLVSHGHAQTAST